ncbi:hypothetical protein BZA77DRAFT_278835 [Pyronema omphalodes]|nr:hypothetical protein BZA77DRAFT_278835 [Pyronema omphalodes]
MPLLLPGDAVIAPASQKKQQLKLGPGLTHTPPDNIVAHKAGELIIDTRKNVIWVEGNGRRYTPTHADPIIVTVLRGSADAYICAIPSSSSPAPSSVQATLPHLAFPNATKKTRPILAPGAVVYARVSLANKHMDPELECFDAESGKAMGFGELKGGMIFSVSLGMARRLLGDGNRMRGVWKREQKMAKKEREESGMVNDAEEEEEWEGTGAEVLEELGRLISFECAVGRNGKVWVEAENVKSTLMVGRCLAAAESLGAEETRDMVRREVRALQG